MAHWNPHEDSYSAEELSSRRNESKDHQANPEVCWDHTGRAQPLALTDLTDEEKNVSNQPTYPFFPQIVSTTVRHRAHSSDSSYFRHLLIPP